MELEVEGCDDAEVPAAAAQRPEEIGVLVLIGPDDTSVGEDDLCREHVVARQTTAPREVADAAAERESADARR